MFRRGSPSTKVHVQGKGPVVLTQQDFRGSGGEGAVYVKGDTAYKLYGDPKKMIPTAKIQELSVLTLPDIIRPQDVLVDSSGTPVGYTMRFVKDAFPVCQMFPKAFRIREHVTPEKVAGLVQVFRDGVQHVHDHGILIVDMNELNFLIDKGFENVYFIDTDSYQTPGFAATAIMDSIRDRHSPNGKFSTGTDWFSFAVLSFMMFVGIHPYKGKHPTLTDLDSKMMNNVSVLSREVSVPPACMPFDVIPSGYRSWYELVLQKGDRCEPPEKVEGPMVIVVQSISTVGSSGAIDVTEVLTVPGDVIFYNDGIAVTQTHVTNGRTFVESPGPGARIAKLPISGQHVLVWIDGRRLGISGFETRKEFVNSEVAADEITSVDGRVYVKQSTNVYELRFAEMPQRTVVSLHHVGNVTENSTQVFDGVFISDLLGAYHAVILPAKGECYNVHLKELDGSKIIDARYVNNVLMVVGHREGRYDRFIFRFGPDHMAYDARIVEDIHYAGLNFTVPDSGVCVSVNEKDEVEMFSNRMGSGEIKVLKDPAVDQDIRLFKSGSRLVGTRGDSVYRLSMIANGGAHH